MAQQNISEWKTQVSSKAYEITHTADCAIFGFSEEGLKILLVKRGIEPFKGHWMLPGGIVQEGETLELATKNVLDKLLGLKESVFTQQVKTYSEVNRHPIKRVITTCFYALVKPENLEINARAYIDEMQWNSVTEVKTLGFDHVRILKDALEKLKREILYNPLCFHLMPDRFTLKELQNLYEVVLGESLDRRNFRRKLNALNLVEETKEKKSGAKGGPALFKFNSNQNTSNNKTI